MRWKPSGPRLAKLSTRIVRMSSWAKRRICFWFFRKADSASALPVLVRLDAHDAMHRARRAAVARHLAHREAQRGALAADVARDRVLGVDMRARDVDRRGVRHEGRAAAREAARDLDARAR